MSTSERERTAPAADADRKPDSPADLRPRSWKYVGRKSLREFLADQCTDLAAALTYYAVLAIPPAMLALVSLLGLVGRADESVDTALDVIGPLVSDSTLDAVRPVLEDLAASDVAGLTAVVGLLGALWSASAYVTAFGRAMNRVYEIEEGRPIWKLRPVMLLVTLIALLMAAAALVILVVSGPVADSLGSVVGLGDTVLTVWSIAKWPVLAAVMVLVVALLYYATPNVEQPKFRWVSVGAAVALAVWVLASLAFTFYVANFASYNATYGALGGVIIALLWLWITNLALLFGAEIDSELERGRELQAGIAAEEELQLPPRDTRKIEDNREKEAEDVDRGRELRRAADAARTENDHEEGKDA